MEIEQSAMINLLSRGVYPKMSEKAACQLALKSAGESEIFFYIEKSKNQKDEPYHDVTAIPCTLHGGDADRTNFYYRFTFDLAVAGGLRNVELHIHVTDRSGLDEVLASFNGVKVKATLKCVLEIKRHRERGLQDWAGLIVPPAF